MTKKILRMLYVMIVCFIVIVCMGVFCGCSGENLEEYKKTKAEELQTYSDAKGERNYSADDRQAICDAVVTGKAAIADATTKEAVDTAFNDAKTAIDALDFENYKETKTEELQTYADDLGELNYDSEGWQAVCDAVATGKTAIAEATTKEAVDTAFNDAKTAINAVEMDETILGNFYTLQEAYDGGMLTVEDLQVIAEYHEKKVSAPEEINPGILKKIKEVAARDMREKKNYEDAKAEDYHLIRYYGFYNGCVAFMINHPYYFYYAVMLDENEIVAGVRFHYTDPKRIVVWSIL